MKLLTVVEKLGPELQAGNVAMVLTLRAIAIKALADGERNISVFGWQERDVMYGNAALDCRNAMKKARKSAPANQHSP